MEQKRKISLYKKIRRDFHVRVEESEKKHRNKIIALALITLLLASALLFCAALLEKSTKGQYVYYYGDVEQKIKAESETHVVDFIALADFCSMTKEVSINNASFEINNTKASFTNGSDIVKINGISIKMPSAAAIKNGYCLVPLSILERISHGLNIVTDKNETTIQIEGKIFMIAKDFEVSYETDVTEYLEYIHSKDEYIYTLVNKQNPVDRTFPEDQDALIEIPEEYRKSDVIYLHYIAEKALEAMMQDMFACGYNDTYVTSAYRRYDKQQQIFDKYVNDLVNQGMSYNDAYAEVLKDTALPGQSEHQTGLCVDLTTKTIVTVDNRFADTEVFAWLQDNAWKYGFVLRYPEDKVNITGYSYESWHYRFVGYDIAKIMHQTGLCYEEYLENFGDN
ncbi:MAG: D-alanyl-D-alanine carboxypeptidase family protein [Clostridia bacterium]|nr:D-alanyl-D-alanine carboxypeptidase family protein [Clostridia bacterium]